MTVRGIDQTPLMEITLGNVRRENLNAEEFASLKEVGNGLSRSSIPDEHKKRLIELRLVKEELGNLRLNSARNLPRPPRKRSARGHASRPPRLVKKSERKQLLEGSVKR